MTYNKKTFKITLIKSPIGCPSSHRACVKGLGLRKIHQTSEIADTPPNRGMVNKISYMIKVWEQS